MVPEEVHGIVFARECMEAIGIVRFTKFTNNPIVNFVRQYRYELKLFAVFLAYGPVFACFFIHIDDLFIVVETGLVIGLSDLIIATFIAFGFKKDEVKGLLASIEGIVLASKRLFFFDIYVAGDAGIVGFTINRFFFRKKP